MRRVLRASVILVAIASGCAQSDDGRAAATEGSSTASGTSVATSTASQHESTGASESIGDTTLGADATASTATSAATTDATTDGSDATEGAPVIPWEEGSIRVLPSIEVDLVEHVLSLEHPNDGDYVVLDAERQASFEALLAALDTALALTLSDPEAADWCGVLELAQTAGYELHRLRDTATGRWLLYGADASPTAPGSRTSNDSFSPIHPA